MDGFRPGDRRLSDALPAAGRLSYGLTVPPWKETAMNPSKNTSGAVPTSSGRNGYANHRMLWIGGIVAAFLAVAIFFPW